MFKFNSLPKHGEHLRVCEYQNEMIFLMHFLLDNKQADLAGKYSHEKIKKPLFKDSRNIYLDEKPVLSIDVSRGKELLKESPFKLKNPEKVRLLMSWLVQEFEIIRTSAEQMYKKPLDEDSQLLLMISGAAHSLASPNEIKIIPQKKENFSQNIPSPKADFISQMALPEKILLGSGAFFLVVGLIVFYHSFPTLVHYSLAALLCLFSLFSFLSVLFFWKRGALTPKYLFEIMKHIIFAVILAVYLLFLLSILNQVEGQAPYGIFLATFLIVMVIVYIGYRSLLHIFSALIEFEAKEYWSYLHKRLVKYEKNFSKLGQIAYILFFSSIIISVLSNFSEIWGMYTAIYYLKK